MGWRWCWWLIWRWCCCGLLPPLLCVFLQLCSPLFSFLPSASHGAVVDWEGNGSWRWCWWRWRGIRRCLTVVMKVVVAGKLDDSSGFLLLLPRAEAQVAAFSLMVQQRVGGRWWAEEGWLWRGQCCCVVLLVALVSRQPAVVTLPLLFCRCFFSLFLSPCFSPNNSLSLSLGFPFFSFSPPCIYRQPGERFTIPCPSAGHDLPLPSSWWQGMRVWVVSVSGQVGGERRRGWVGKRFQKSSSPLSLHLQGRRSCIVPFKTAPCRFFFLKKRKKNWKLPKNGLWQYACYAHFTIFLFT